PKQQHVFYRSDGGAIQHIFYDQATNQLYADNWTDRGLDPVWIPTGSRAVAEPRFNCDAVLLPSGDVFMTGGCRVWRSDNDAVHNPEVYHPDTDTWETLPAAAIVPRDYHSVALLLPDGRVWTAGSNFNGQQSFPPPQPQPQPVDQGGPIQAYLSDTRERRIEIFEPDYFGRSDRPRIDSAPAVVFHAETFHVASADAAVVS